MNTGSHDHLTRGLEREADQFARRGGTALDMSQVLDRAGEIRRGRRMRATMVMAACVLAIAVPTVLIAVNRDATHEPAPAPAPKVDSSAITLAGLKTGAEPRTGYVQNGILHLGAFTYSSSGERFVDFVSFSGGTLVAIEDKDGNVRASASTISPTPNAQDYPASWPVSGGFAVSAGGHVAAFVEPDGTPVVVQAGTSYTLPRIPRGSGFSVVAVSGEDCKETETNAGCTVWVNSSGRKPETWVSTSHGFADTVPTDMRAVADVSHDMIAGMTSATDDSSCSAIEDTDGKALWSTCTYQFASFSPAGRLLAAYPGYFDGAGSSEVAVLDAASGKVLVDLHTTQDGYLRQVVWEDDEHLLAVVGEGTRAAILRIGLDGSREYALPPTATEPYESPFVLPSL